MKGPLNPVNERQILHVQFDEEGRSTTVTLSGEFDLLGEEDAMCALARCTGDELIVDLTDLTFLGTSGLAVLVAAQRASELAGRRFEVRGARTYVRRVFEMAGLSYLLVA